MSQMQGTNATAVRFSEMRNQMGANNGSTLNLPVFRVDNVTMWNLGM